MGRVNIFGSAKRKKNRQLQEDGKCRTEILPLRDEAQTQEKVGERGRLAEQKRGGKGAKAGRGASFRHRYWKKQESPSIGEGLTETP